MWYNRYMGAAAELLRSGIRARRHYSAISPWSVDFPSIILGLNVEKSSIEGFKPKRIFQKKLEKDQAVDIGFHMLQLYYIRELRYYEYI